MEIIVKEITGLEQAARQLLAALPEGARVLAFHGGMGAGKTTFIAALARVLGVEEDEVNSPTFAIVNHYRTAGGEDIYHFDMYRLEDASQALDIGAEEYLDSGALCLVEWPENTPGLLPEDTVDITIEELPDGSRRISF